MRGMFLQSRRASPFVRRLNESSGDLSHGGTRCSIYRPLTPFHVEAPLSFSLSTWPGSMLRRASNPLSSWQSCSLPLPAQAGAARVRGARTAIFSTATPCSSSVDRRTAIAVSIASHVVCLPTSILTSARPPAARRATPRIWNSSSTRRAYRRLGPLVSFARLTKRSPKQLSPH